MNITQEEFPPAGRNFLVRRLRRGASAALAAALLAAVTNADGAQAEAAGARPQAAKAERCVPEEAPERLTEEQLACLGEPYGPLIKDLQEADAVADARREAGEGDFRFLRFMPVFSDGPGSFLPGIACAFRPPGSLVRAEAPLFDDEYVRSEGHRFFQRALTAYAPAYNRTLVSHEKFPYPDICRLRTAEEKGDNIFLRLSALRHRPDPGRRPQTLHEAARFHDRAALRRLLKQKADLNRIDGWDFTPLGWAVLTGRADLVADLTTAGADPNRHGENAPTPLDLAVITRSLKLVRQLVAAGADVNRYSPIYAVHEEATLPIMAHCCTPLWEAVTLGEIEVARFLLEKGADPNLDTGFDYTPVFSAIKGRRGDLIALLLEHEADVRRRNRVGLSAIQAAAEQRDGEAVRLIAQAGGLADARSGAERELWQTALKENRPEILAELVAFGAHAHLLKTSERETLRTHIAGNRRKDIQELLALADKRAGELEEAVKAGDLGRVKRIYRGGAQVAEGRMRTGLIMAVQARQVAVIAWYLEQGADPLSYDYYGNLYWLRDTSRGGPYAGPVHNALQEAFLRGPVEVARLVATHADTSGLKKFPDPDSLLSMAFSGFDTHRDPAILDLAVELSGPPAGRGVEADALLGALCSWTGGFGTDVLGTYLKRGYRPLDREGPPPSEPQDPNEYRALTNCLYTGAAHALLILRHGASAGRIGSDGGLPLMMALDRLHADAAYLGVIEELLKRGAAPNRPDRYGRVALDEAQPDPVSTELQARLDVLERAEGGGWIVPAGGVDAEKAARRLKVLKKELAGRFAKAWNLLRKYGAKTREELEEDGVLKPPPEAEERAIPVR